MFFFCRHSLTSLVLEVNANKKLSLYYMVPATLYGIYNNLAFVNLAVFDPTTYFMLLQTRLFFTAITYQVFNHVIACQTLKLWHSLKSLTDSYGSQIEWKTVDFNCYINNGLCHTKDGSKWKRQGESPPIYESQLYQNQLWIRSGPYPRSSKSWKVTKN